MVRPEATPGADQAHHSSNQQTVNNKIIWFPIEKKTFLDISNFILIHHSQYVASTSLRPKPLLIFLFSLSNGLRPKSVRNFFSRVLRVIK